MDPVGTDDAKPTRFGELVRYYRERRGMSQERLGKETHFTGGYISQIESGKRGQRPPRDTVISIAQALGAPAGRLLEAADRLLPGDDVEPHEVTFEQVVQRDPRLRSDQKRILTALYSSWVGPPR